MAIGTSGTGLPSRSKARAEEKISGFFAWIFWIFLHIFWLIGFRNRFVVMTEWAWAYFSLQRRVRLITGERIT